MSHKSEGISQIYKRKKKTSANLITLHFLARNKTDCRTGFINCMQLMWTSVGCKTVIKSLSTRQCSGKRTDLGIWSISFWMEHLRVGHSVWEKAKTICCWSVDNFLSRHVSWSSGLIGRFSISPWRSRLSLHLGSLCKYTITVSFDFYCAAMISSYPQVCCSHWCKSKTPAESLIQSFIYLTNSVCWSKAVVDLWVFFSEYNKCTWWYHIMCNEYSSVKQWDKIMVFFFPPA